MPEQVCYEVNDRSPNILEHFVCNSNGQLIRQIRTSLEASWNDATRLPHMLMTGPPGLGKSQMSSILAQEMGSNLHEQLAQNISSPRHLNGFLLQPGDREVALIDEIHELPKVAQTTLYRALENQKIFIGSPEKQRSRTVRIANFTLLAATTDPHKLLRPLVDRFKLILPFDYYSEDDLETMLRQRSKQLGWQIQEQVFPLISTMGRGTPRIALRLLEASRRTARSNSDDIVTVDHFNKTCSMQGLDNLGLGPGERKYLKILSDHSQDGQPVRIGIMASVMGMHRGAIQEIENYLLRIALITKTDAGRQLTDAGKKHLQRTMM